jgi:hypothetical protein
MNTNTILGIVAAGVIVVALGFFLLRPASVPAPVEVPSQTAATTTSTISQPVKTGTQPTVTLGTPTSQTARASTQFDPSSLISTSTYPTITGTANVPLLTLIISNSKGVGIVGTADVPVVNGHWSYPCSVALPPGAYTVILYVNKTVSAGARLTVNKP